MRLVESDIWMALLAKNKQARFVSPFFSLGVCTIPHSKEKVLRQMSSQGVQHVSQFDEKYVA